MAFNSGNDPDLLIGVEFLGKNLSSRKNDPSIHIGGEGIISTHRFKRAGESVRDIKERLQIKKRKLLKQIEIIKKDYST